MAQREFYRNRLYADVNGELLKRDAKPIIPWAMLLKKTVKAGFLTCSRLSGLPGGIRQ